MIRVNEDYVIEVDQYNFTVKFDKHKKYLNEKTGTETDVYDIVGHYSTLEGALSGCLKDIQIKKLSDKIYSLESAIKCVRETTKEFTSVMGKVLEEEA